MNQGFLLITKKRASSITIRSKQPTGNNMIDNRTIKRKLPLFLFAIFIFGTITFIIKRSPSIKNAIENIDSILTNTNSRCKGVSIEELDQWFHSKKWNEIPKIIHQTWKNKTLRKQQALWSQTWCEQYSDWRYHLWTDEENDVFVQTKFPWFYSTYKQLSPAILQVDSVRYLYMLYYGGLYIDLDYESIRRVDELLTDKNVVLSLINYSFNSMNSVPNSWMASRPNHPLWTYVIYRIMLLWSRVTDTERDEFWNGKAEFFTGPQSLFEGLMLYLHINEHTDQSLDQLFEDRGNQTSDAILEVANITFLGPKLINAYDWMSGIGVDVCSAERKTFDEVKCKDIVKPIYAITYWSHSYGHGHDNDINYLGNNSTQ